jgi:hypothetical protein
MNQPIFNEQYHTEGEEDSEDDSDDKAYRNFYNFISTQAINNLDLQNYIINEVGLFELGDEQFLTNDAIRNIYLLLGDEEKKTMKNNYLPIIRKIIGVQNINWIEGGKRRKSLRKSKSKRRKSLRKKRYRKSKSKN